MASPFIRFPTLSDRRLIELFQKLRANRSEPMTITGYTVGEVQLGPWAFSDKEPPSYWKEVLESGGQTIRHATVSIGQLTLSYQRGGSDHSDPYFDRLVFSFDSGQAEGLKDLRFALDLFFATELHPTTEGRGAGAPLQALGEIHNSLLERLESATTAVIEQNVELSKKLQIEAQEERKNNAALLEADRERQQQLNRPGNQGGWLV